MDLAPIGRDAVNMFQSVARSNVATTSQVLGDTRTQLGASRGIFDDIAGAIEDTIQDIEQVATDSAEAVAETVEEVAEEAEQITEEVVDTTKGLTGDMDANGDQVISQGDGTTTVPARTRDPNEREDTGTWNTYDNQDSDMTADEWAEMYGPYIDRYDFAENSRDGNTPIDINGYINEEIQRTAQEGIWHGGEYEGDSLDTYTYEDLNKMGGYISPTTTNPLTGKTITNFKPPADMEAWRLMSDDQRLNTYYRENFTRVASILQGQYVNTTGHGPAMTGRPKMSDIFEALAGEYSKLELYSRREQLTPPEPGPEPGPTPGPDPGPTPEPPGPDPGPTPEPPGPTPEPPGPEPTPPEPPQPTPQPIPPQPIPTPEVHPSMPDDLEPFKEFNHDFEKLILSKRTVDKGLVEYTMKSNLTPEMAIYDTGSSITKKELGSYWMSLFGSVNTIRSAGGNMFEKLLQFGQIQGGKSHFSMLNRTLSLVSEAQGYNWLGGELSFGRPKNLLDIIASFHDAEWFIKGSLDKEADRTFVDRCEAMKHGFLTGQYRDLDTGEVEDFISTTNMEANDYVMLNQAPNLIMKLQMAFGEDSYSMKFLGFMKDHFGIDIMGKRTPTKDQQYLKLINEKIHQLQDLETKTREQQFQIIKEQEKRAVSDKSVMLYKHLLGDVLRGEDLRTKIRYLTRYLDGHKSALNNVQYKVPRVELIGY